MATSSALLTLPLRGRGQVLLLSIAALVAGPVSCALVRVSRSRTERQIGATVRMALGVVAMMFLLRNPWLLDDLVERFALNGIAIAFAARSTVGGPVWVL